MSSRRSWFYVVCWLSFSACGADSGGTPDDCDGPVSDLEAELYTSTQGCTAVVRLAFDTYEPTSWALFCGPYAEVSEAAARSTAKASVDYGMDLSDQAPGATVNAPNPLDAYVFQLQPVDFGGFAVVSARTGLAVLGGQLSWSAHAEVRYPSKWRERSLLGTGCETHISLPTPQIYDFAIDSLAPTPADIERVYAAVGETALPTAFATQGVVSDVVLIRLQRTVDGSSMATSTSEWVALLGGGALQ